MLTPDNLCKARVLVDSFTDDDYLVGDNILLRDLTEYAEYAMPLVTRLREALSKYGRHKHGCRIKP